MAPPKTFAGLTNAQCLQLIQSIRVKYQQGAYDKAPGEFEAFRERFTNLLTAEIKRLQDPAATLNVKDIILYFAIAEVYAPQSSFIDSLLPYFNGERTIEGEPWYSDTYIEEFVSGLLRFKLEPESEPETEPDSQPEKKKEPQKEICEIVFKQLQERASQENFLTIKNYKPILLMIAAITSLNDNIETNDEIFFQLTGLSFTEKMTLIPYLILCRYPVHKFTEELIKWYQDFKEPKEYSEKFLAELWLLSQYISVVDHFRWHFKDLEQDTDKEIKKLQGLKELAKSAITLLESHFNAHGITTLATEIAKLMLPIPPVHVNAIRQAFTIQNMLRTAKIVPKRAETLDKLMLGFFLETEINAQVMPVMQFKVLSASSLYSALMTWWFRKLEVFFTQDMAFIDLNPNTEALEVIGIPDVYSGPACQSKLLYAWIKSQIHIKTHDAEQRRHNGRVLQQALRDLRSIGQMQATPQTYYAIIENLSQTLFFLSQIEVSDEKIISELSYQLQTLIIHFFDRARLEKIEKDDCWENALHPLLLASSTYGTDYRESYLNVKEKRQESLRAIIEQAIRRGIDNPTLPLEWFIKTLTHAVGLGYRLQHYRNAILKIFTDTDEMLRSSPNKYIREEIKEVLFNLGMFLLYSDSFRKTANIVLSSEEYQAVRNVTNYCNDGREISYESDSPMLLDEAEKILKELKVVEDVRRVYVSNFGWKLMFKYKNVMGDAIVDIVDHRFRKNRADLIFSRWQGEVIRGRDEYCTLVVNLNSNKDLKEELTGVVEKNYRELVPFHVENLMDLRFWLDSGETHKFPEEIITNIKFYIDSGNVAPTHILSIITHLLCVRNLFPKQSGRIDNLLRALPLIGPERKNKKSTSAKSASEDCILLKENIFPNIMLDIVTIGNLPDALRKLLITQFDNNIRNNKIKFKFKSSGNTEPSGDSDSSGSQSLFVDCNIDFFSFAKILLFMVRSGLSIQHYTESILGLPEMQTGEFNFALYDAEQIDLIYQLAKHFENSLPSVKKVIIDIEKRVAALMQNDVAARKPILTNLTKLVVFEKHAKEFPLNFLRNVQDILSKRAPAPDLYGIDHRSCLQVKTSDKPLEFSGLEQLSTPVLLKLFAQIYNEWKVSKGENHFFLPFSLLPSKWHASAYSQLSALQPICEREHWQLVMSGNIVTAIWCQTMGKAEMCSDAECEQPSFKLLIPGDGVSFNNAYEAVSAHYSGFMETKNLAAAPRYCQFRPRNGSDGIALSLSDVASDGHPPISTEFYIDCSNVPGSVITASNFSVGAFLQNRFSISTLLNKLKDKQQDKFTFKSHLYFIIKTLCLNMQRNFLLAEGEQAQLKDFFVALVPNSEESKGLHLALERVQTEISMHRFVGEQNLPTVCKLLEGISADVLQQFGVSINEMLSQSKLRSDSAPQVQLKIVPGKLC